MGWWSKLQNMHGMNIRFTYRGGNCCPLNSIVLSNIEMTMGTGVLPLLLNAILGKGGAML